MTWLEADPHDGSRFECRPYQRPTTRLVVERDSAGYRWRVERELRRGTWVPVAESRAPVAELLEAQRACEHEAMLRAMV